MLRRLLTGVTAAATALLGACDEAPRSTVLFSSGQANTYLDYAASRGPLWIQTQGTPFGLSGSHLTEAVGRAVKAAITQRVIATTSEPAEAGDAGFFLAFAFDGAAAQDPNHLCRAKGPATLTNPTANTDDRLNVLAVFCNGTTLEAAVRGSVPYPANSDDKAFADIIKQMTRQIFPVNVRGQ